VRAATNGALPNKAIPDLSKDRASSFFLERAHLKANATPQLPLRHTEVSGWTRR